MDEQNKVGLTQKTDSISQTEELNGVNPPIQPPILPSEEKAELAQERGAVPTPTPVADTAQASDILAPQKKLSETLDTLKEYENTPGVPVIYRRRSNPRGRRRSSPAGECRR